MIAAALALFAKPAAKYVAVGLAFLALAGIVTYVLSNTFNKGVKSGESTVTIAVESKTIEATEKARKEKEAADEKIRATPYDDRVDGLR